MSKLKIFVIILFTFFITTINCSASVDTFERSDSNLRVPDDIVVDSSNIKDIKNTPSVSSSEKIYDYADLLTVKEEEKLYKKVSEFINKDDVDLIILTTNNLNNYDISDYTINFYKYNFFKKNAVIFTIYINNIEPEIYMYNNGDKVASVFTNDVINEILEYVYQNIDNGKYYDAVNDFIKIVDGFYDIEANGGGSYKIDDKGNLKKIIPLIDITILATTLSFVIVFVFIYLIKGKNKKSCNTINISDKLDNSTLSVKCDNDMPYMSSSTDNK